MKITTPIANTKKSSNILKHPEVSFIKSEKDIMDTTPIENMMTELDKYILKRVKPVYYKANLVA